MTTTFNGLDDVVAAQTQLSHVDGERGELIVAGWPLQELVQHFDYSAAAALLWRPFAPDADAGSVARELGLARLSAWNALLPYANKLRKLPALEALRLGLDLSADQPELETPAGVAGTMLAAFALHLQPEPVGLAPDADAEPIADMLRLCRGESADAALVKGLTRYLVTVADHGLNASTFTSRVIASTRSDLRSCTVGAIGALKGPIHGGAPGPVLDMLDAIASPERAGDWVDAELAAGRRLMGFGHRIYRVRDPRADVLKQALKDLQAGLNDDLVLARLSGAEEIEATILERLRRHKPDRVLDTNVEFYTALLLDALGFERADFTGVFALGRVLGWVAHALEQQATGRLIRPQSVYVGPKEA